jgi:hypothetical protein
MIQVDPAVNSSPAAFLAFIPAIQILQAYAIIKIGEFKWQNITQQKPTEPIAV